MVLPGMVKSSSISVVLRINAMILLRHIMSLKRIPTNACCTYSCFAKTERFFFVTAVSLDDNTHFHPIQEASVNFNDSVKDNA